MMDSQFNPLLKENVPPVLVEASADSNVEWGTCWFVPCAKRAWTSVYVRTLDVNPSTVKVIAGSGLRLLVLLAGNAWVARNVGEGLRSVTVEADLDYWTEYLVRYEVIVNLTDARGNLMDPAYRTQVKGVFAGVLEFLEWLGSAIAAIAEAVAEALNFLKEILVGIARAILDPVIGVLKSRFTAAVGAVEIQMERIFDELRQSNPSPEHHGSVAGDMMFALVTTTSLLLFVPLYAAMYTIEIVLKPFFFIVAAILILISLLLIAAILDLIGNLIPPEGEAPPDGTTPATDAINEVPAELWWGSRAVHTMNAWIATMIRLAGALALSQHVGRAVVGAALASTGFIMMIASAALFGTNTPEAGWISLAMAVGGLVFSSFGLGMALTAPIDTPLAPFTILALVAISSFSVLLSVLGLSRAVSKVRGT